MCVFECVLVCTQHIISYAQFCFSSRKAEHINITKTPLRGFIVMTEQEKPRGLFTLDVVRVMLSSLTE